VTDQSLEEQPRTLRLLTLQQVADELSTKPNTIRGHVASGICRPFRSAATVSGVPNAPSSRTTSGPPTPKPAPTSHAATSRPHLRQRSRDSEEGVQSNGSGVVKGSVIMTVVPEADSSSGRWSDVMVMVPS
jgi:hypothetical protein